jgi:hypothetical protein
MSCVSPARRHRPDGSASISGTSVINSPSNPVNGMCAASHTCRWCIIQFCWRTNAGNWSINDSITETPECGNCSPSVCWFHELSMISNSRSVAVISQIRVVLSGKSSCQWSPPHKPLADSHQKRPSRDRGCEAGWMKQVPGNSAGKFIMAACTVLPTRRVSS